MMIRHLTGTATAVQLSATLPLALKDGLPVVAVRSGIPAALPAQSLLLEGEDARLNGMTRSLQRRLLGLNLPERISRHIATAVLRAA